MSASSKKKLRKEQVAAAMTERQQMEKKEAKKLKRNTILFVVAISLVLVAFVGILAYQWVTTNGLFEKATTAATIDGKEINSVEFNYYYIDTALNQANEISSYAEYFGGDMKMMGLDPAVALNKQNYAEDQTWSDYIMDLALEKAQSDYALSAAAKKAGYKLSKEDQETLKTISSNLDTYAMIGGYEDADGYLRAQYGNGATKKSYLSYTKRGMIASGFYNEYSDGLSFSADDIRAHDAKDPAKYNSYDYTYYYVNASNYLEGGTKGEDGKTTYSDEEQAASREKAKEIADQLGALTTLEELTAAVKELEVKGAKNQNVTTSHNVAYASVLAKLQEWVTSADRKAGEITVIVNETEATEETEAVINGYYVVCYEGTSTNDSGKMTSVRHLLIKFPEATKEEDHEGHDHEEEPTEEPTTEATVEPTTEATVEPTTEATVEPTTEATEPVEGEDTTEPVEGEDTETEGEEEEETISETDRTAAREKAEKLLKEWQDGDATEESFIELVKKNSEDTSASTGGLFENIHAGSNYVENFLNWSIDANRKAGDVEIVETEYGYHIMYFVEWEENTYRDQMILDDLKSEALESWYDGHLEATPAKLGKTKYIKKNLKLSNFGF